MSVRLQVLLDEQEMLEIRSLAGRQRMSVSEWVRQTLRTARLQKPAGDADRKLRAVRSAARHEFPTADMDQMNLEIESGYGAT